MGGGGGMHAPPCTSLVAVDHVVPPRGVVLLLESEKGGVGLTEHPILTFKYGWGGVRQQGRTPPTSTTTRGGEGGTTSTTQHPTCRGGHHCPFWDHIEPRGHESISSTQGTPHRAPPTPTPTPNPAANTLGE